MSDQLYSREEVMNAVTYGLNTLARGAATAEWRTALSRKFYQWQDNPDWLVELSVLLIHYSWGPIDEATLKLTSILRRSVLMLRAHRDLRLPFNPIEAIEAAQKELEG